MVDVVHICVAMKPLEGNLPQNALKHGVAGLNVDGCRVNPGELVPGGGNEKASHGGRYGSGETSGVRPKVKPHNQGRWPANVILDGSEEVMAAFPVTGSKTFLRGGPPRKASSHLMQIGEHSRDEAIMNYGDRGSASRYFKVIK